MIHLTLYEDFSTKAINYSAPPVLPIDQTLYNGYYWKLPTQEPHLWIALTRIGMPESIQKKVKKEWVKWLMTVQKEYHKCYVSLNKYSDKNLLESWEGYAPGLDQQNYLKLNLYEDKGEIEVTKEDLRCK